MIIRRERRDRYTTVDNDAIEDGRLTFKALGVLVYLLSRPDNWEASYRHLSTTHDEGEYAVRQALSELEQFGYLDRQRRQDPGTGQWRWVQVIREAPDVTDANAKIADHAAVIHARETHAAETAPEQRTDQQDTDQQDDDSLRSSGATTATTDPDVERLCERLADAIEAHRGGEDRPAITKQWHKDMRLLLTRGPKELAKPEPVTAERVERGIAYTFRALSTPAADGFCWARVIRSPGALRRNWTKIRDAARDAARRQTVLEFGPPLAEDQAHDVEAARQFNRTCATGQCDGSGWLDEEFDPFNASGPPSVARPCSSCRPSTEATA